LLLQFPQ